MNTTLKVVLGFVGGATVGSLATYYIVRESFRKQADEQVESIRRSFIEKYAKLEDEAGSEENPKDMDEWIEESIKTINEVTGRKLVWEDEIDYDDDSGVNPVDEYPGEYPTGIEEIDKAEFFNSFDEKNGADNPYTDYNEVALTYYIDGVLADDREDDVTDEKNMYFLDLDLDSYIPGDTLYFANHTHMFKIELTVSKQSYKRDILGEGEEEELGDFADKSDEE